MKYKILIKIWDIQEKHISLYCKNKTRVVLDTIILIYYYLKEKIKIN